MPIIHFINSKTQTAKGMKNVLAYVTRTEKTKSEDKQYVTSLNCSAPSAHDEMLATKNAYHKNSGRMYYHLVQSFPKGDDTSPELAHRIAVELAEKAFGNYECVVATHIDREQAEKFRRMETQNAIENAQSDCDFTVGALDLVAGISDVASIIDEPTEDEDIERNSDSKILAEEIRRKEALGMHMG